MYWDDSEETSRNSTWINSEAPKVSIASDSGAEISVRKLFGDSPVARHRFTTALAQTAFKIFAVLREQLGVDIRTTVYSL